MSVTLVFWIREHCKLGYLGDGNKVHTLRRNVVKTPCQMCCFHKYHHRTCNKEMYSTSYVGFYISITRPINKQHVYDCIIMSILYLDKTTFTQTWLHVCALDMCSVTHFQLTIHIIPYTLQQYHSCLIQRSFLRLKFIYFKILI